MRFTDVVKTEVSKSLWHGEDGKNDGSDANEVVPDGFVVLHDRGRSESELGINSDSDSNEDDDDEEGGEKPLFATKATMSVFLSERWITVASAVAARDKATSLEKEKHDKIRAESKANNGNRTSLWHHVLTSNSVKEYSSIYEQNELSSATNVVKKVTQSTTKVAVEEVTVTEKDWWRALYKQDVEVLRKYASSSEFASKMVASILPRLEESTVLTSLREEMKTEKDVLSFDAWLSKYRGTTPTQIASGIGSPGVLHILISLAPGSVSTRDRRYKRSPMLFCCEAGSFESVRILLRAGCELEVSDRDRLGDSALHKAVRSNNTTLTSWIAQRWSKKAINLRNKDSATPLFLCYSRAMAVTLIKYRANPFLLNNEGLDAVCLAARSGKADLLSLYLACNVNNQIHYANSDTVKALPAVSDTMMVCKANPLELAIKHGKLACVQVLCSYFQKLDMEERQVVRPHRPVSVNSKAPNEGITVDKVTGFSPLHFAVIHGQGDIVRSLLSRKDYALEDFLLFAEDKQGAVPLVLAAVFDQKECLEIITEECRRRKLSLLSTTYKNSRKECLLTTFLRMKDPMGLRIDRREGDDYQKLLDGTVHFIRTARVPITETFFSEVSHKNHKSAILLNRGRTDEECRFSDVEEYRGLAERLSAPSCPLLDSLLREGTLGDDIDLVCTDGRIVPANMHNLNLISPSLGALVRFRVSQDEDDEEDVEDEYDEGEDGHLRVRVGSLPSEQLATIVHFSHHAKLPARTSPLEVLALVPVVEELLLAESFRCELQRHLICRALNFSSAPLLLIAALRFTSILPSLRACAAKTLLVAMGSSGASETLFEDTEEAQSFGVTALDALIQPC